MKDNHEHLGTQLPSVHSEGRNPYLTLLKLILRNTLFNVLSESIQIPCWVSAPRRGAVLTLLSLKMLFLEHKCPRKVCVPALRAIPHPGNGTHHQRYIYGNKFK